MDRTAMIRPLDRARLAGMRRTIIRPGSAAKPCLTLYEEGAERFVVKDCRDMHPALRGFFGRRNQRREIRVYEHLKGVPGIPKLWGVVDHEAFAVEYVEGRTLSRDHPQRILERAFTELERVLSSMHARGVVHLDLKQKRNILVRSDGRIAVVDFQSALILDHGIKALFLPLLRRRDRAGLLKFKGKYASHLMDEEELKAFRKELFLAKCWPFTSWTRALRKFFRTGGDGEEEA